MASPITSAVLQTRAGAARFPSEAAVTIAEITTIQADITAAEADIATLQTDVTAAEADILALQTQFDTASAVADATDNPSAITQLNALLAELRTVGIIPAS